MFSTPIAAARLATPWRLILGFLAGISPAILCAQEPPRLVVASYNVENYLLSSVDSRPVKSPEARNKVRDSILAIRPDVLALQEIGGTNALFDIQSALKSHGLDLPYWEFVTGYDRTIFVGVLSRFPFRERRSRTNESFLLSGRRFRASRGIAEVDVQVTPKYQFTLLTTHLKSKRPIAAADEAEMRHQEAVILRRIIDERLKRNPQANILICGDFNDNKDTPPIRTLIGRGKKAMVDTRPAEKSGDTVAPEKPGWDPRNITWTHFFGREDTYARFDYILISPGMAKEWQASGTYVLNIPNWGIASDHRPVVAEFIALDR